MKIEEISVTYSDKRNGLEMRSCTVRASVNEGEDDVAQAARVLRGFAEREVADAFGRAEVSLSQANAPTPEPVNLPAPQSPPQDAQKPPDLGPVCSLGDVLFCSDKKGEVRVVPETGRLNKPYGIKANVLGLGEVWLTCWSSSMFAVAQALQSKKAYFTYKLGKPFRGHPQYDLVNITEATG